jgi:hypothetical protein
MVRGAKLDKHEDDNGEDVEDFGDHDGNDDDGDEE